MKSDIIPSGFSSPLDKILLYGSKLMKGQKCTFPIFDFPRTSNVQELLKRIFEWENPLHGRSGRNGMQTLSS